ncbi:MAG: hypothetical protein ACRDMJ_05585 [Solirubrobacteraceae bacterium]
MSSTFGAALDVEAILRCWAALAAVTAVAAATAYMWPSLGPDAAPHPALRPSVGAVVSILVNNLRVLAAPFVLAAARFARVRAGRLAGDAIVAAILASNAISVGLALGRWGTVLVRFIPQLPIEYLAAATAATAWLGARQSPTRPTRLDLILQTSLTAALTAIAAVLEVLLTPHTR